MGLGALTHALQQRADLFKLLWVAVAGVFFSHSRMLGSEKKMVNAFLGLKCAGQSNFDAKNRWQWNWPKDNNMQSAFVSIVG